MTKVNVYVTLRESVVDPQGIAAKEALHSMGHDAVKNVRIGKLIELEVESNTVEADVTKMCDELLINKVIEDYRFEIEGE
ncbi:phosphoribosylformylglycinamidine synthase subunit PurS [Lysinibacillus alkalisoli]|uniref:Phosphoribosylformylglycinamidine synthase subunit PurS n=1 Tax=Lysinibacillus alkalisoli TaxID=1911548 RepID=A0A917LJI9_9BACI|nr:phosphoribosylformylglycinamidine synthase subunit PurS [Lysinibacillus alkalisoli]GGG32458.1 phosphoribosylformylglycinamidine synthase subunit PurS [Lysinibacillus alkalisoli]